MAESFNYAELFNYIEIVLWSLFGLVLLVKSRDSKPDQTHIFYISSIAFFLFAISDYIEIQTGAWWKPWWLFALKAAFVIAFLFCIFKYLKTKSNG
ncbi:MAG: hypothetical protein P1V19_07365 [Gimesia sp.]|nr:hypothetical protein [Gimesia sp.]